MHLLDMIIKPIVIYGFEVWGTSLLQIDWVQVRQILDAPRHTYHWIQTNYTSTKFIQPSNSS